MNKISQYLFLFSLLFCQSAFSQDEYQLNPGDRMNIAVWKEPELTRDVVILPDGTITFPLVGVLKVSGLTINEVLERITVELTKVMADPAVTVTLNQVAGNSVYVIGKVNIPGEVKMDRPIDIMKALSLAGGLSTYANKSEIKVIRRENGKQKVIEFDYDRILEGKSLSSNILMQSGDILIIP